MGCLVSDLHKKSRSPLHFQWPLNILMNLKKNIESYEVQKGNESYGNLYTI